MFSSLYSMLPESKSYLKDDNWHDQEAGFLVMGCFIGGFFGIQAVSRLLHSYMPSHVVDCDHTHNDTASDKDNEHENGHDHSHSHDHGHGHSQDQHEAHPHPTPRRHSRPRSSHQPAHKHTGREHAADGTGETTPLLDHSRNTTVRNPRGRSRTTDVNAVNRRPSMVEVQRRVMSFVRDTKNNCDENGSCYGYTDPCGQECFKHIAQRSFQNVRNPQSRRTTTGHFPETISTQSLDIEYGAHDSPVSPKFRTSRTTSREPLPPPSEADEDYERSDHSGDETDADLESQQHHHHVPTNAFLSIGLQTSIAIALHKFPEGFITYATNHANPELGFNVFMALFVHNISEGFAMCLPLYMALGSRWKAMAWSALLGGLSQPFGALIAVLWFKLANHTNMAPNAVAYACLFAATAGIMVSVALQLFVEGLSLNHNRNLCIFFGFLGMALLGLSNASFAGH
jgi:ZIP family zinc transporter